MSENTKIELCDHSWSPWRGCTKVSAGCANCYAETLSKRNPAVLGQWGKGKPRVLAKNWNDPVRWNRRGSDDVEDALHDFGSDSYTHTSRPTVFPSLCDWLDDEVPVEWLARFLELIQSTPNLTWLLLTKRPENWEQRLREVCVYLQRTVDRHVENPAWRLCDQWLPWNRIQRTPPPRNIWVGTSVEDQEWADKRIPHLLNIPAVGRFLSVEPMLGPVDVRIGFDHLIHPERPTIDWVIFGGEFGPGARPCNVDWIRDGVRQCRSAGVAAFVKQLGKVPHLPSGVPFPLKHPKGGEPAEWFVDLRVRAFPEGLR